MVSAWATANHITLGQRVTDAKNNEITAIPKLLEMLEIKALVCCRPYARLAPARCSLSSVDA